TRRRRRHVMLTATLDDVIAHVRDDDGVDDLRLLLDVVVLIVVDVLALELEEVLERLRQRFGGRARDADEGDADARLELVAAVGDDLGGAVVDSRKVRERHEGARITAMMMTASTRHDGVPFTQSCALWRGRTRVQELRAPRTLPRRCPTTTTPRPGTEV